MGLFLVNDVYTAHNVLHISVAVIPALFIQRKQAGLSAGKLQQ